MWLTPPQLLNHTEKKIESVFSPIVSTRPRERERERGRERGGERERERERMAGLREEVDMFKAWSEGKIVYTGRRTNANKMARILPLFQGFVQDNAGYFKERYGYNPRGEKPGQLSKLYAPFRDVILPQALAELLAETAIRSEVDPATLPPVQYYMKWTTRMDGGWAPRAIYEWEDCSK